MSLLKVPKYALKYTPDPDIPTQTKSGSNRPIIRILAKDVPQHTAKYDPPAREEEERSGSKLPLHGAMQRLVRTKRDALGYLGQCDFDAWEASEG